MRNGNNSHKKSSLRVMTTMALVIIMALVLHSVILSIINKNNALHTTDLLLNQVVDILNRNNNSEHELINELKDEYILRAKGVSYIIDAKPSAEYDVEELKKIAVLMEIDEIHLFDTQGTIYSGTVPKYYGVNFDDGEQVAFFKPMLKDKTLSMCQDVTPNTAESKSMMYAITWNEKGDKMLQVGIEPVRLLEKLKENELSQVIATIPVYDGVSVYFADRRTGNILSTNDDSDKERSLGDFGLSLSDFDGETSIKKTKAIDKFATFINTRIYNDSIIIATSSTAPQLTNFLISLLLMFIYLTVAAFAILIRVRKEEKLILESNTDALTGLYNRRAYENDIVEHKDKITEENFVYISLDLNGLKIANDTEGHEAGDELIAGTAECMRRCFGSYGRLYRIGGDEFAAMIFADKAHLEHIKVDFEATVLMWKGKHIKSLSVSAGYGPVYEVNTSSVKECASYAEKKMYEAKTAFYRKKGFDRRGQQDAHTALCALYEKILKVNITDNTYIIINMNLEEKTPEKGFADSLSEWLSNFGTTGQVHPEDLAEYLEKTSLKYLREYFAGDKNSIAVFYRRKVNNQYKQYVMEMIPANDYSDDNQSLFLYVKSIDKVS